jgi:hypothetical protein
VHQALLTRASQMETDDALGTKLRDAAAKSEAIRKKIVATQEGGAITGEERIREKTSQVYGALNFYEGRPADYYIARIDSLSRELENVMHEFEAFAAKDLHDTNAALEKRHLKPVTPMARAQWEGANPESGMSPNASGRLVSNLAIFGR